MVILVKSITDLKTPQPYHGKNLARLARECFANRQSLTLDFEGIETNVIKLRNKPLIYLALL